MMRWTAALMLALLAAAVVDRLAARRGFDPPGFVDPTRRLCAGLGLAFIFFIGIFYPAMTFDQLPAVDLEAISPIQLFFSQLLLIGWLVVWWVLGYVAPAPVRDGFPQVLLPGDVRAPNLRGDSSNGTENADEEEAAASPSWIDLLGLRVRHVSTELSVGLAGGVVGWLAVLSAVLLLGLLVTKVGGDGLLNQEPAAQIVWLASLPVGLRLAISLAAGVVEEVFFRGFLQPRVGIAASTVLFVGAHLAYGEPFMLFGISLLSLYYAWLVVWRGNVWAAMTAHFLFDAIQLLVIIPAVLRAHEMS